MSSPTALPFTHPAGIPIHTSPRSVGLAREFPLPPRRLLGHWEVSRSPPDRLEVSTRRVSLSGPREVPVRELPLDRTEARGVGFSEMQSYFSLPFHDTSVSGDVCARRDPHDRQMYDALHVCSSNPTWLYTFSPNDDKVLRGRGHLRQTSLASPVSFLPLSPFSPGAEDAPQPLLRHQEARGHSEVRGNDNFTLYLSKTCINCMTARRAIWESEKLGYECKLGDCSFNNY